MELNATLLVQMVHFGVAYVVVRYLLVRPALRILLVERQQHTRLEEEVRVAEQKAAEHRRHNEQEWALLTKRLRSECPAGIVRNPVATEPSTEAMMPDTHDRDRIVEGDVQRVAAHIAREIARHD